MKKINGRNCWFLLLLTLISFNACKADNRKNTIAANKDSTVLLAYKIREAKGTEKPVLVILMHGFGANDDDLLPIASSFPENYIVVTPQAPYQIGTDNYQWYTSQKTTDGNPGGNQKEIDSSLSKITIFIKHFQEQYKVSPQRTFVGGFSQGAILSYELGLKNPSLFKGIGVLSGMIFNSLKKEKISSNIDSLQVFIGHGDMDDRIPYKEAEASNRWLEKHNIHPDFHTYKGMGHSIDPQEISDFLQFMQKNISNK